MAEFVGLRSQYSEGETLSFAYQDYQPSLIGRAGIQTSQITFSLGGVGIGSSDLSGTGLIWQPSSGTFTHSRSVAWSSVTGLGSTASISLRIVPDGMTEGTEYLSISVGALSTQVAILDTSQATALSPTYSISPPSMPVSEGQSATFTLSTTNVSAGTAVNYTISGVSASDIVGGQLSGSVAIGANGQAMTRVKC